MSSKIEWTSDSWNPIRAGRYKGEEAETYRTGTHCEILSPGCEHCYAQGMNRVWGTGLPFRRTEREKVAIFINERILELPLRWKKPRKIFVCSTSDLFGEWVPREMQRRVFRVMRDAPHHTYQILTKRTAIMRDFMQWWVAEHLDQPPANWWFGGSVEDQRRANERIPEIQATPAAVRWISAEPLLEGVDLMWAFWRRMALSEMPGHALNDGCTEGITLRRNGINWVVVGGESGPGARPFNIGWARSIIEQCKAAGVAVFIKQVGAKPYYGVPEHGPKLRHGKGADPEEWPVDIRRREYPQ